MSAARENIAVLRERWPEMARRLRAGPSGRPVALRAADEAQLLARHWLAGRRIHRGALLAVSGFGDGSHVRALLSVLPQDAIVFVGEADALALRSVLEQVDLRGVLADARLQLGVGALDEAFFAPLRQVPVLEILDVEPLIYAPHFNQAPDWYGRFFTEFARAIDFHRKLQGTQVADAALWQANSFANLELLGPAPDVAALRGALRGLPLVLVSAGPSLDESLDFLRAACRVAVIVAVNSSYRAVRRAGIVPHFVLAADPREFTSLGFAGVTVDGTWLVTTPIVHPEVVRLFAGRTFIWSATNPLLTELRRRAGLPPGTMLVEQGTVSACAVDLATILGCDRVCLVGQDLAIRPDGRSHAVDSFYTDRGMNHLDPATCRRLPGNTLPEVLVEEKLYVYLKTFEELAVHRPHLKFRNTARLGARIAGMPYADFAAALRWLGGRSAVEVGSIIAGRHATGNGTGLSREALVAGLHSTVEYARALLPRALALAARCEACPAEKLGPAFVDDPEVRSLIEAADALRAEVQAKPAEYAILESGRTRFEFFRGRMDLAKVAGLPPHGRKLLADREYVWAIVEGVWFLQCSLQRFFNSTSPGSHSVKTG